MLAASVAVGQNGGAAEAENAGNSPGEPVQIQERNRSKGETGLVTTSDGYSLRLSNAKENGGGGAVYGCRTQTAAPTQERACLYADNLRGGEAFLFRSRQGSKVGHFDLGNPAGAPFSTNATGRVGNLNSDRVDDLHASEIVSEARAKAGLAAATADSATKADSATDADTVDGVHASGLRVKSAFTDTNAVMFLGGAPLALMSVPITLDVASNVLVNAMIEIDSDGGANDRVFCRLSRGLYGNAISREMQGDIPEGSFDRTWFGMTGAAALGPGTHDIKLFCVEAAGDTTAVQGNLTVMAIPN